MVSERLGVPVPASRRKPGMDLRASQAERINISRSVGEKEGPSPVVPNNTIP
jgi:hypothetical protein